MLVDDIVKLLLAGSFSFSIIGISYALIKFILSTVDIVKEVKRPVANIGELSDLALEDYRNIREIIKTLTRVVKSVNGYLDNPMLLFKNMSGLLGRKSQS